MVEYSLLVKLVLTVSVVGTHGFCCWYSRFLLLILTVSVVGYSKFLYGRCPLFLRLVLTVSMVGYSEVPWVVPTIPTVVTHRFYGWVLRGSMGSTHYSCGWYSPFLWLGTQRFHG